MSPAKQPGRLKRRAEASSERQLPGFGLRSSDGRLHPLLQPQTVIGRDTSSTIRLADATVSRRHATLILGRHRLLVRDEGSANGTFVDDQRVSGTRALSVGSRLRVGSSFFTVEAIAPGAAQGHPGGEPGSLSGSPSGTVVVMAAVGALAVITLFLVGSRAGGEGGALSRLRPASSPGFHQDAAGFSFRYPPDWRLEATSQPTTELVLTPPGNHQGPPPQITVAVVEQPYQRTPLTVGIRGLAPVRAAGVQGRRHTTVGAAPYDATVVELPFGQRTLRLTAPSRDNQNPGKSDLAPAFDALLGSLHIEAPT